MDKVWRRFLLGYLLNAVLMLPIGYLIYQMFPLLGYANPKEAPEVLRAAALMLFVAILLIVCRLAAGDAYDELDRRQKEKKKRSK